MFSKLFIFCAVAIVIQSIPGQCGCNQGIQAPTYIYEQFQAPTLNKQFVQPQNCGCKQTQPTCTKQIFQTPWNKQTVQSKPCGCSNSGQNPYNQVIEVPTCNKEVVQPQPCWNQVFQAPTRVIEEIIPVPGCNEVILEEIIETPTWTNQIQTCGCNQPKIQTCGCNQPKYNHIVKPCGSRYTPYIVSLTVSPTPLQGYPHIPAGMSIASDNLLISGPVVAMGKLPFEGTVALEGALPACGAGSVMYECGDTVMINEAPLGLSSLEYGSCGCERIYY